MGCGGSKADADVEPAAVVPDLQAAAAEHSVGEKGRSLGVRVGWLVKFLSGLRPGIKTHEVVEEVIKPATQALLCRYADLKAVREEQAIGPATAFVSHCWGGMFADVVAAAAHVLGPDDFCWIGATL